MMRQHQRLRTVFSGLVLASLCTALAGCGGGGGYTPGPADPSEARVEAIYTAYERHVEEKGPPQSVEDLKPYLQESGNPDELLVSPNDNQPYTILFGSDLQSYLNSDGDAPIVIHEQQGKDGLRWIMQEDGSSNQIDDEEFQTTPKFGA